MSTNQEPGLCVRGWGVSYPHWIEEVAVANPVHGESGGGERENRRREAANKARRASILKKTKVPGTCIEKIERSKEVRRPASRHILGNSSTAIKERRKVYYKRLKNRGGREQRDSRGIIEQRRSKQQNLY